MQGKDYVLVTPARNEAQYIEKTIESVISQTAPPKRWIIVSDGSTDATDDIVKSYSAKFDFIELIRRDCRLVRDFGSKVKAINAGYNRIQNLEFDYFGNLDADIAFDPDYYATIMDRFEKDPKLGIAGGAVLEVKKVRRTKTFYRDGVGCAVHFFRRQCYEGIGGYLPMRFGGEDTIAETMAKMQNWHVRSYPEIIVRHLRPRGTGMWSGYRIPFNRGVADYFIGYHPVFFIIKSLFRFREKPFFLSTALMLCGYFYSYSRKVNSQVPPVVVQHLRKEQMRKLQALLDSAKKKFYFN
jgi:glycosyltransferase involved in cell wall biosynthesis